MDEVGVTMILVTTGSLSFNAGSVTYHDTDRALVEVRDNSGVFMVFIFQNTYRKILLNVSAGKSVVINNSL